MKLSPLIISATLFAFAAPVAPTLALAAAPQTPTSAAKAAEFADGIVRKVDAQQKKFTLEHGEIKSLGMPPMTMNYLVRDTALLSKFKAGDKVRFKVVQEGSNYIVTEMQPATAR